MKPSNTNEIKNSVPIYVVIGTRAQFIKVAPMLRMMIDQGIEYQLIYTAQHTETIEEILDVYNLPAPDKILYHREEANTRELFAKWFKSMLFTSIFKARKVLPERGIVLTHGDTFTTWLAAIMGRLAGCKVCHLESGLRSFNIFEPFPEEISRIITFLLSNVYFCPGQWATNNLRHFRGKKVDIKINPMYDGVQYALKHTSTKKFDFFSEKFVIFSVHRYENIFGERLTEQIIPLMKAVAKKTKVVVTMHPTTRKRLQALNLYDELNATPNIVLHERFNFLDWIVVCNKAEFIFTDGGSNQEELSYLGVPTLLLRKTTERKEGLDQNIVLSKLDKNIIDDFVKNYTKYRTKPLKLDQSPSQIIIDYLKENMLYENRK